MLMTRGRKARGKLLFRTAQRTPVTCVLWWMLVTRGAQCMPRTRGHLCILVTGRTQ